MDLRCKQIINRKGHIRNMTNNLNCPNEVLLNELASSSSSSRCVIGMPQKNNI